MQCPIDQTELVMTERQGVEIDYCPKCRGVWLDRGELDKIIERSAEFSSAEGGAGGSFGKGQFETPEVGGLKGRVQQLGDRVDDRRRRDDDDDDDYDDRYRRDDQRYGKKRKKKRGSFLEDLFDFD